MVEAVELKADEIETLRTVIRQYNPPTRSDDEKRESALAILDRLAPKAKEPEVDEATLVWREMTAQAYEAVNNSGMAEAWRTGEMDASKWQAGQLHHLREVLAAKDAERDQYAGLYAERCGDLLKVQAELATLRAENEIMKAVIVEANNSLYGSQSYFLSFDGAEPNKYHLAKPIEDMKARSNRLWRSLQAAERNPAESERRLASERPASAGEVVRSPSSRSSDGSGTDTAGVEVQQAKVTEADRKVWKDALYSHHGEEAVVIAHHRTEAEARGRREALEKTDDEWERILRRVLYAHVNHSTNIYADFSTPAFDELKRMMTEPKP